MCVDGASNRLVFEQDKASLRISLGRALEISNPATRFHFDEARQSQLCHTNRKLVEETIFLIDVSLKHAESFLPSPQAVHQLVYEFVRSSAVLQKQQSYLQKVTHEGSRINNADRRGSSASTMRSILSTVSYYEKKVQEGKTINATAVLRIIAKEVDRDGLYGSKDKNEDDPPKRSGDFGEISFVRHACADGLALTPGPDQG